MELDPSNPNLDGDFKELIEVRKRRHVEKLPEKDDGSEKNRPPKIEEERDESVFSAETKTSLLSDQNSNLGDGNGHAMLKLQLIDAARSDNLQALQNHLAVVQEMQLSLCQPHLRFSENQSTVLHLALDNDAMKVADYLIKNGEEKILTEEYEVVVRNTPSFKTALHQLCEKGNLELVKTMLNRIKDGKLKEAFLRKTVLTQIKGQRPRHLSCIHISAVNGNPELVEYLVVMGLDVNFLNNKHDTPILWAARWNHLKTARKLIHLGADLQHQNDKGSTPLYWAVRYGFKEMVELLIREGKADVHQKRKLGLISPIVLASTLGYTDIIKVLLDNGADVNTKITSGFTPLHHAAQEGNLETVKLLLRYGAHVNSQNDSGDSPLLVATQAKQLEIFAWLAQNGGDIDERNKDGMSVWDYAIASQSTDLLQKMVKIYKKLKGQEKSKLVFGSGKTPLHKAALKDDCDKLQCLIELGAETSATDESGNNFFHIAARENCVNVLKTLKDAVDVDSQNKDGDTALHLACRSGHEEAVDVLLKKSKVDLKNNDGDTALHTACRSKVSQPKLINAMMDTIVKAHNWSLVDSADKHGNTSLHIVAKTGRFELFHELKPVNCRLQNSNGDCAQHVVVQMGQRDVVEEFFNIFRKEMLIDQQNVNGDSVMHIAAQVGNSDMMEYLISSGADLSVKNLNGNSPMHELIFQSAVCSQDMNQYLYTLDAIHNNVVQWWCMRNDLHIPDDESELYMEIKRQSYLLLTSGVYNNDGDNALSLAARHGIKEMFERILHTPDVYMFIEERGFVTFDVTRLSWNTVKKQNYKSNSSVQPYIDIQDSKDEKRNSMLKSTEDLDDKTKKTVSQSYLSIIVRSRNIRKANEMLDVIPLHQMVSDNWAPYKWLYGLLLVLHIIYMSLLSVYGVQNVSFSLGNPSYQPSSFPVGFLLIWPILLLLHLVFMVITGIYNRCTGLQESEPALDDIHGSENKLLLALKICFGFFTYYMSSFTQFAFASLVLAWYVLYLLKLSAMAHVLAAALILGWIYSIVFTPGFEAVHSYSIMIKIIVIKDISRFLFIYIFILMAFSFAMQSLLHLAPLETQGEYPNTTDIIFAVFNMMIGMHDPFSEAISGGIDKFGLAAPYIKVTYLFYIILTTIILLNLLIAMMTDSYANVKANEGTSWRVSSVRMALDMDTTLPLFPKIFNLFGMRKFIPRYDFKKNGWMMSIPRAEIEKNETKMEDKTAQSLSQLDRDINRVQNMYMSLDAKVDALMDRIECVLSDKKSDDSVSKQPLSKRRSSVFQPQRSLLAKKVTDIIAKGRRK